MFDSAGKSDVLFHLFQCSKINNEVGEVIGQGEGGHAAFLPRPQDLAPTPLFSKSWNIGTKLIHIYIYFLKNNNNKTIRTFRHLAKSSTYVFAPAIDDSQPCSIIPMALLGTFGTNGTNFCAANPATVTNVTLKTSKTDAAFTKLQKPATANDKHHQKHQKSTDFGELPRI